MARYADAPCPRSCPGFLAHLPGKTSRQPPIQETGDRQPVIGNWQAGVEFEPQIPQLAKPLGFRRTAHLLADPAPVWAVTKGRCASPAVAIEIHRILAAAAATRHCGSSVIVAMKSARAACGMRRDPPIFTDRS